MTKAAELCVSSAREQGIDNVRLWTADEVAERFDYFREHQSEHGVAYWTWKPFIINEEIQRLPDNSILIYCDAGVKWIDSPNHVIERMDQDIFLFGNEWQHAHWCKRDIVDEIVGCLPWEAFGKQVQASVIFLRVNDHTRAFVKEWLDWCLFEGGRLVDDSPSRAPNHPEFRENRYDQAILTTLAYRDGIKLHGWFVRYETYEPARAHYPEDTYPTLFLHHRLRDDEWEGHSVS